MDCVVKKIKNCFPNAKNCLVVGTLFGRLTEGVNLFDNLFVVSNSLSIRARNIIYRSTFDKLETLSRVDLIVFDRDQIDNLIKTVPVWHRHHSSICIQGREVIGRDQSLPLYQSNYRAIIQEKKFHIWKYL